MGMYGTGEPTWPGDFARYVWNGRTDLTGGLCAIRMERANRRDRGTLLDTHGTGEPTWPGDFARYAWNGRTDLTGGLCSVRIERANRPDRRTLRDGILRMEFVYFLSFLS